MSVKLQPINAYLFLGVCAKADHVFHRRHANTSFLPPIVSATN